MQKAVWATYFYMASIDTNPSHELCPKDADTWCKFKKAHFRGELYVEKEHLPPFVFEAVKPIRHQLANLELLSKCL